MRRPAIDRPRKAARLLIGAMALCWTGCDDTRRAQAIATVSALVGGKGGDSSLLICPPEFTSEDFSSVIHIPELAKCNASKINVRNEGLLLDEGGWIAYAQCRSGIELTVALMPVQCSNTRAFLLDAIYQSSSGGKELYRVDEQQKERRLHPSAN